MTEYLYDSAGRMRSIKDPRGLTYLTNTDDASSRVSQQRMIDWGTNNFAYMLNGGKVTESLVTNPRGFQRRVTFNASGQ